MTSESAGKWDLDSSAPSRREVAGERARTLSEMFEGYRQSDSEVDRIHRAQTLAFGEADRVMAYHAFALNEFSQALRRADAILAERTTAPVPAPLPCPFPSCGSPNVKVITDEQVCVICDDCGASGPSRDSREEAVRAWDEATRPK